MLVWLPDVNARNNLYSNETVRIDGEAIRAYYYTRLTADGDKRLALACITEKEKACWRQ